MRADSGKRMVELPVKIGDRLYTIHDGEPRKYVVERITIYGKDHNMLIQAKGTTYGGFEIVPEQIGFDIYRTMDEAIEALRRTKKGEGAGSGEQAVRAERKED